MSKNNIINRDLDVINGQYLHNGTPIPTTDNHVSNIQLVGTDLQVTGVGTAFNGTIDLSSLGGGGGGGSTDYVSNVTLVGSNLTFTGVGSAFNSTVDLSSLTPTPDYISNVVLNGTNLEFTGNGNAFNSTVDLSSLSGGGSTDYVSNVVLNGTDLEFTGVGSAFNSTVDLSSLTTGKPQLFIYPGSTPGDRTLNGYGIGKLDAGVGNPGSIGTPTLTLEIPKILNFGDSIIWKTRVREAGFNGMRLKLWSNYLIGTSSTYVVPFQSGAYGTPIIVDLEINIIKFEGASSSKRYRIEVNQINYYVTETSITTAEENNRYHIANDSIDQFGLPLFVNTYPLFIGLSDTDPFITQDDLTWEFTKSGGGAFGLDYSYSKLITG